MQYSRRSYTFLISFVSFLIPVVVAVLLFFPQTGKLGDIDVSFLPHLNAVLNTSTAIALLIGYFFIKRKQEGKHRIAMLTAFLLSSLFLISYVVYHYQSPSTKYLGEGFLRNAYYFILITHIVLAAVIVPFVLFSLYYALTRQIVKHRKVSKWTFPLWLYVAVSGVVVYLMISPYYTH